MKDDYPIIFIPGNILNKIANKYKIKINEADIDEEKIKEILSFYKYRIKEILGE